MSKVDQDDLDLGNGAKNDIELIDMDQEDIGNEENAMIQQKFNTPGSNECHAEVINEIDNQVKTKLGISDILQVEIDTGYRKRQFSSIYKITGLLGVGSFGVVMQVTNIQSGETVALKVISQENQKALFQTELMEQQVLNELQHTNIITFKKILYSTNHVFIEMEKINGGTLESFIKSRKSKARKCLKLNTAESALSNQNSESSPSKESESSPLPYIDKSKVLEEDVAASICRDICNGLQQIHRKNFIHRDMKPENILIDEKFFKDGTQPSNPQEKYTAKIADFGLSAEVHSNVFHGHDNINEVMGTILFMAPEQATGQRYGKRVDMWALGIIVFQMLTGKHPFYKSGDTEESYTNRISKTELNKTLKIYFQKYDISPLAQSLISRLLARGISDRYRVAQALAHPWITRIFTDKAPLTQNEQTLQMEGEIKLRNMQSIVLFLAISKQGRLTQASPNNKKTSQLITQQELINRMNPHHRKQYSGLISSVVNNTELNIQQLSQSINSNNNKKSNFLNFKEHQKQMKMQFAQKRANLVKNNQTIDHGQHHEVDELDQDNNFSPQKLQYSPQIIREKDGLSRSPMRIGGSANFQYNKMIELRQSMIPPITSLIEPSYLQRIRKYCSEGGDFSQNDTEDMTEASTQSTTQSNSNKKAHRGLRSSQTHVSQPQGYQQTIQHSKTMVKKDAQSKRIQQNELSGLNQQVWNQKSNQYPHQLKGTIMKPKIGGGPHTQVTASISSASGLKSQLTQKEKISSANNLLPEIAGSTTIESGQQFVTSNHFKKRHTLNNNQNQFPNNKLM